jgi:hypothetical protein
MIPSLKIPDGSVGAHAARLPTRRWAAAAALSAARVDIEQPLHSAVARHARLVTAQAELWMRRALLVCDAERWQGSCHRGYAWGEAMQRAAPQQHGTTAEFVYFSSKI